jgi:bifunctional DNA-binding transcriptional regulator/antitoxin component of YhaV-PrlF toxin-antitoxin module
MTSKNVTITSKNQITLPAEYVRKLHLAKHRRLTIRQRGDELVLKPEPELDVEDHFRKLWAQLPKVKGTKTDEQLKKTTREAWARKKI